jgi:hypothetical protein
VRLVAEAVGADAAPELHINMGSLHYALGELDAALACFERALTIIDADLASSASVADDAAAQAPADDLRPLRVTCAYNLARVCEARCDFARAETLYKEITANNPKYVDCTLCSVCVCICKRRLYPSRCNGTQSRSAARRQFVVEGSAERRFGKRAACAQLVLMPRSGSFGQLVVAGISTCAVT